MSLNSRRIGIAALLLLACTKPTPPTPTPAVPSASAPVATAPIAIAASSTPASAPTTCTASPPITLEANTPNASAPISVALTADAVWVLHMGRTGVDRSSPILLEVHDFETGTPRLAEHALPPGSIGSSSALAVSQTGIVVGTFVGTKGVNFFSVPKSDPNVYTVPAGDITSGGSIAVVGAKALTAFGQDDDGVHTAYFDIATGARQGVEKISGKVQQATVAGAFGGLTVFSDFTSSPGVLRARGASGAPFALPAVGTDNGTSAAASGVGDRAYVLYNVIGPRTPGAMFPQNTLKLATLTDASGNGTTVELGHAGMVPENAVQAAAWGAVGAFIDATNAVMAVAVDRGGKLTVVPMRVTPPGERARRPAVAVAGMEAVVVWNQAGAAPALRMSVMRCR